MKKLISKLLVLALIALVLGTGGYYGYRYWQKLQLNSARPQLKQAKDGTSISAGWYKTAAYKQQLQKKYSFINKVANYVPPRTWDGKDAVIPGLVTTKSYDFTKKKANLAKGMTPQGLTVAGKYLLITAYDGDHQHASVIYVLNKKTGKYLKTVQVRGKPHLGGITYDKKAKNIWVTGKLNGSSALMAISLKKLKAYREQTNQPITYRYEIAIPTIEKASTVTYYANQLFVGFFNMYGRGRIASYAIKRSGKHQGSISNNELSAVTGTISWSDPNGETSMDKQIQGIAFYQDKLFLSQSYGGSDSKLYVFSTNALRDLDEKNAELVINMPPYLEQVVVYKGQLLCLFESGAKKYARSQIMIMDRILSVNINALFGI